ncbi:SDR family NAD(P)-dependent oxidoreductase [Arthrobacter sp. 9E18]|uniref:SDR family NAD(P)-dependent oxidoreductase n=1 Tax=Arthrobacter sp. 9E18 TaxID=2058889 RepID=UPI000CE52998|nr:SDR family NAD(P)-dependent oxidoreductase [Arthrobacter sp. 9E18]
MAIFPERRTAVVTGTGSERGIGRHVARRLVREGWAVAVLDLDEAGVHSFAAELAAEAVQPVLGIAVDVADPASVEAAFGGVSRSKISGSPRNRTRTCALAGSRHLV